MHKGDDRIDGEGIMAIAGHLAAGLPRLTGSAFASSLRIHPHSAGMTEARLAQGHDTGTL